MTTIKLKAFLVEDDAIIRMMVSDLLQATGYAEGVAPDEFRDQPLLRKLFTMEALSAAINQVRTVG